MIGSYETNTLRYDESRCSGCGLCAIVCPHGVFALDGGVARLARAQACMECGACQRNCPTGAIEVESGVGCATALFYAALTGREACCGPTDEPCSAAHHEQDRAVAPPCCGPTDTPDDAAEPSPVERTSSSCCETDDDSPATTRGSGGRCRA